MSSWTSVLQQIAELDPDDFDPADLSDERLRETMPLAHVALNRLSAVLTRCVAAGEARQVHAADGSCSMKAWLTGYLRMSGTEAAGYVRAGRRLSQLPELAAAYADGAVSAAHVQVVTAALTPARLAAAAETGVDVATTDRVFTEAARALARRTPAGRCGGGCSVSTPTAPWTTMPGCRACFDWPRAAAVGCTCPGTWTRSAARRCTRRWRR